MPAIPLSNYIVLKAENKQEALRLLDLLSHEIKRAPTKKDISKVVPTSLARNIYVVHDEILI